MSTRVRVMNKAYAGAEDGAREALRGRERLANPLGDRFHLDRRAGDLAQQLVGVHPLALRPELAEERAGVAAREPRVAEALAQESAQLRLERPRAQVRGHVEARVDVAEVVGRARLDLQGVSEQLDVAWLQCGRVVGGVELQLVQQLRAVAADEIEQSGRALRRELLRPRHVEAPEE